MEPPMLYLKNLIRKTITPHRGVRYFIFGSTSDGTDHSSSDIDLAFVLPASLKISLFTKDVEMLQNLCREKFSKRVSVIFVGEKEFKKQSKDLYKVILRGVEITS